MLRKTRALIALLLGLMAATPATATVRNDPARLSALDRTTIPVLGQPYSNVLVLEAGRDVVFRSPQLHGEGWSAAMQHATSEGVLRKGERLELPITMIPTDFSKPLTLEVELDGIKTVFPLDIDPETIARAQRYGPLRVVDLVVTEGVDAGEARPGVPSPPSSDRTEMKPGNPRGPGVAAPRNVRVRGRIVYERQDGELVGVYGMWARVYDTDNLFGDSELVSETTDSDGDFDVTFSWDATCFLCEQVDIKVKFETDNSEVFTRSNNIFAGPYRFATDTEQNYSGTNLNIGTVTPADEDLMPGLHIHTDITRSWNWYESERNVDLPKVTAVWPDDDISTAYYNSVLSEIHVSPNNEWNEATHSHEYGHHFVNIRATAVAPDYCNDVCDPNPDAFPPDCTHCQWCEENGHDAFAEGFPNFIAHVQTTNFLSRYGLAAMTTRDQESVATCQEDELFDSPTITEGFIGALMQDIWDSNNEDDPSGLGAAALRDRLTLGHDEILDVVDFDAPTTTSGFINDFKARFPQHTNLLWETARNNRFDLDTQLPSPVTNLQSSSHTVNVGNVDPTIRMTWTRAADDWSGPEGYSIAFTATALMPDQTAEVGDVTSFTGPTLAPGSYFACVRTMDRDGRWDNGFAQAGPFVILPPDPSNLTPVLTAGWAQPFVPQRTTGTTSTSAPAAAELLGDVDSTYWNARITNDGDVTLTGGYRDETWVDGVQADSSLRSAPVGGGTIYSHLDRGPITVRGGHHAIVGFADGNDIRAESNEDDNVNGTQYVWLPVTMGSTIARNAPPDNNGGWDQITTNNGFFNADGVRFTHGGFTGNLWRGVWSHADSLDEDYDLRLHSPTTGAGNGFRTNVGFSSRDAGCTDAVIVRRPNTLVTQTWDVGVLNQSEGTSGYTLRNQSASNVAFGSTVSVPLGTGGMFALRSLSLATADTGHVSIVATITSGQGPIRVGYFPGTFTSGDLLDAAATGVIGSGQSVRIELHLTDANSPAVAVYRDPKDGTAPVTVQLQWGRTPPDFANATPSGWYGGLVPRPASDATVASVPLPDTLHGNASSTRWNFSSVNNSTVAFSGSAKHSVFVDDVAVVNQTVTSQAAGQLFVNINSGASNVRGGRHTVTWELDVPDTIPERFETNNDTGEQFVWSPAVLGLNASLTRSQPPVKDAGWDRVDHGNSGGLFFNCDGLRTPLFASSGSDGFWGGVNVMPGQDTADVDVRLHELAGGTKNGFRGNLGLSTFGPGESDFCLVNFRSTAFRRFDVGVLRDRAGSTYSVMAVNSVFRGSSPNATFGPFALNGLRSLDLHEVALTAGTWAIDVLNDAGSIDWGTSFHGPGTFHTKSNAAAVANSNGPGVDERLTVNVTQPGDYCVAVWKTRSADVLLSGNYRLLIRPFVLDAEGPVTGRTAFTNVFPSPFRSSTVLAFELAREDDAALEVFDLRGARVRTLAKGRWAPGSHRVEWRGDDDRGRPLAPGVYLARFRSGTVDVRRKLVRLD